MTDISHFPCPGIPPGYSNRSKVQRNMGSACPYPHIIQCGAPSLLVPAVALPPHLCCSVTKISWLARPGWLWDPSAVSHRSGVGRWNYRGLKPGFEMLIQIIRSTDCTLACTQALWFLYITINGKELFTRACSDRTRRNGFKQKVDLD